MKDEPSGVVVAVAHHDSRPHSPAATHGYVAVCNVRSDGSRPPGYLHYDADGGFPERNASYCELSVLRWAEQRTTSPVVGLAHYRRVLATRPPRGASRGSAPGEHLVRSWDWAEPPPVARPQALLTALDNRDWLTPRPYDVRRAGFASLLEQWRANHPEPVLQAADVALRELRPELPSLVEHLRSTTATPLYNVFLGRRTVLPSWTGLLWPVLEAVSERLDTAALDHYQHRWAGFLAERLHGYWLQHVAVPGGVRSAQLPLLRLDDGSGRPSASTRVRALLPPAVTLRATLLLRRAGQV